VATIKAATVDGGGSNSSPKAIDYTNATHTPGVSTGSGTTPVIADGSLARRGGIPNTSATQSGSSPIVVSPIVFPTKPEAPGSSVVGPSLLSSLAPSVAPYSPERRPPAPSGPTSEGTSQAPPLALTINVQMLDARSAREWMTSPDISRHIAEAYDRYKSRT